MLRMGEKRRSTCEHVYAVSAMIGIRTLLLTIAGKYSVNQVILLQFQLIIEHDAPKKNDMSGN